ncbi:Adenosylmethionine-8-amino-7-oxononanoate aminotransferase [Georgfuchsia toluolica]|uniref:Adenosylmethionine-8-amino-7-oxononanoate aminotransferase n=2 Tax=Georgfuchsia toluolica TaxID=424218 RepID=A0A916J2Y8_9PROT|nr:Adenosylmethionine-8-amino-7-oxononanoate aminotransferase [Georgfuchsia toluolica]
MVVFLSHFMPSPHFPRNPHALLSRSMAAVWHPCTQMKQHEQLPLLPIVRGQGPWLYDADGKRYFDAISSWWVNLFGHANPRINAALREQMETLEHVMLAGCTHEPVVALSERLSALTGGTLGHCFYASDGASATEIALKMSHHYWRNAGRAQKHAFLCLEGGYHGETVGALSVTDVPIFRDAYAPLLRAIRTVPSPDARHAVAGETAADVARLAASALEQVLEREHGHIAALIVEPLVQCANGFVMYDPEYLRLVRVLCDRYGVHLIFDEIAVGCGRSGTFFAHEQAQVRPDLLCLSKGISGGYLPLSVVMCTDAIYQAFYDDSVARGFLHSHSYTGNPLACRAALTVLDIFEDDDVLATNAERAAFLSEQLLPLQVHPHARHFRQRGMIWAFDVTDAPVDFSRRFSAAALERELLLRPIGNTVYLMPPYVLDKESSAWLAQGVIDTLNAVVPA